MTNASYFDASDRGDPFEFRRQTYRVKSGYTELLYGENCVIVASAV